MIKEKSIKLIQILNDLIEKYNKSKNDVVRDIVVQEFKNRNMKASLAINILTEKIELSTLDIDNSRDLILLFVFTKALYTALTTKDIDGNTIGEINEYSNLLVEDYFTKVEVENLKDYKEEKTSYDKEEIVFPKMNKIAPGFWQGHISAKYLAELDAGNEFIYNFKTQRDPVIDIYGMKRIHLDKKSVKDIVDGLLSGEQFPTTLVVNILHDGTDEIIYNEKTEDLTIVSGVKNLVDGQHRKVATSLAIEKQPNLDFNWMLVIINYSEIKAQKYMVEINKQQKMKQEHIKNLDASTLGNNVVDVIKDINASEFATKIKDSDDELKHGGLTKKSILSIAIEEVYKKELTNRLQVRNIAKHIANVMDFIMGLYVNEFIVNVEETKKSSFINNKNIFAGYIALSEKVYNDNNWENKIEEALSKVDFSKNNEFWNSIKLSDSDISKSTRKNLYDYFSDLV
jgi:hypothetical protein